MALQQLQHTVSEMSPLSKVSVVIALMLLVLLPLLFRSWPKQTPPCHRSKSERAEEMKQTFKSVEKAHGTSNANDAMKVGCQVSELRPPLTS